MTDKNGNSYITGSFSNQTEYGDLLLNGFGEKDMFIAKYNSQGNCIWAKNAGGESEDRGYGIALDSQGNWYVTGVFKLSAAFDNKVVKSYSHYDAFVCKYSSIGDCIWVLNAGGDSGDALATEHNGTTYFLTWSGFSGSTRFVAIKLSKGNTFISKVK